MQMDFFDSELIILEVQKYPCLYDIRVQEFKNRQMKKDSWILVTKAVVGEIWNEMDEENKTQSGKEIQKRWRSLKDRYIKSLKIRTEKMDVPQHLKNFMFSINSYRFLYQPPKQERPQET